MTSSRERTELALARIADPTGEGARSCLTVYADAARAAADAADARARSGRPLGPLDGAVVTIKDLFDVAGEVTRAGSAVLAKRGSPAVADAPTIARLREAGAVIVAKTNMTEFAFSGVGANPHFGTPGNPADRKRIPGGSSSGGAVACADGIGEITIGTDTGGSTRIPAALCGIVGYKPTAKRITREGAYPLSFALDSIGPMARSVADCYRADAGLAAERPEPLQAADLGSIRIGLVQGLVLENMDRIVAPAFERALGKLGNAKRVDVTLDLSMMVGVNERGGIAPPEAYAIHRTLLSEAGDGVDPFVRARIMRAAPMSAADYIQNMRDREAGISRMQAAFNDLDVLALPTTPIVAPTMDEVATPDGFAARNALLLRNTSIANFFDLCAISLPLKLGNSLPCGLMLFARHGNDRKLFQVAAAVEKALAA
ncbi:amidase [Bradyrhizobium sp. LHD-71]|uniref:amidase n=1 Tax=Bradyrhizobium sp. LHD-71 TaxID=3072141 RepID=UPI0028105328|nr:amidase [Bradyrhizobium sp. LHD-71]MDQ8728424.1 amidase [Bradyrhizobium sp. LHD-71]